MRKRRYRREPKIDSRCRNCGHIIRPQKKSKSHRCSFCGLEMSRAKLSDTWKVSRLPSENISWLNPYR